MFTGVTQGGGDLIARRAEFAPHAIRESNGLPRIDGIGWRDQHPVGHEPREDGRHQVLANFIEAEAACLTLGVMAGGTQRGKVIIAVHEHGRVEVDDPRGIRRADERVQ